MRVPVVATGNAGAPVPVVTGRRTVTAYDVGKEGQIIVRASTPERPYEVFAVENGELRCLTKQNDAFLAQIQLGRVEETEFKSFRRN